MNNRTFPIERLYININETEKLERDISIRRSIEKYLMIRQWCYGNVLDFACGCGYGSYLISKNPDVKKVYGIDNNITAICWADKHFKNNKIEFVQTDTGLFTTGVGFFDKEIDTMVCLETIEHIEDKDLVPDTANRLNVKQLLLSFPSKKTTHYNKYHFYDYDTETICKLFNQYCIVEEIELYKEMKVLRMKQKEIKND